MNKWEYWPLLCWDVRYLNRKQQSIHMYKRLIISLICIFLFVVLSNMGLTATAVYLYKDMYVDSDEKGRQVMVSRSHKQVRVRGTLARKFTSNIRH